MPDGETLHVGGIAAESKDATAALLDACLEMASAPPRPVRVSCFVPNRAEGFEAALVERGFSCEPYHYLSRPLTPLSGEVNGFEGDGWRDDDPTSAAELLRTAYGDDGRQFAPRGTLTEWEHYTRGLVERPGCGDLEPAITRVVRDAGTMIALVLSTRVAPAHRSGADRRASGKTTRGLRAKARGRSLPPRAAARRAPGDAAGGREERRRASSMRRWASSPAPPSSQRLRRFRRPVLFDRPMCSDLPCIGRQPPKLRPGTRPALVLFRSRID